MDRNGLLPRALGLSLLLLVGCGAPSEEHRTWRTYGGDPGGSRYSELDQIDRENVDQLEVAWVYHTGDAIQDPASTMECNPIVVDGTAYVTSPQMKVIALDAATGEEEWTFDPVEERRAIVNRGVTYWEEGDDGRILFAAGGWLHALDAETGRPVESFGTGGRVGVSFRSSSPGVVYRDLIIYGTRSSPRISAFDVRTGEKAWTFHTIPRPGEYGYETWPEGAWKTQIGANAWGGMTVDRERGLVFAATASPDPDFYGKARHGKNLFGNSVVALDARTGERVWHYQTIHHGIWDLDLPAPPNLVRIEHEGAEVDAVAQVTKTGQVFVLDRETGEPLFPVEERPVPASDLPGEKAYPTQPFPTEPEPFSRQAFARDLITDRTPEAHRAVLERYREVRAGSLFIPPSTQGTVVYPGFHGGAEWSGASFDPTSDMLYVNGNEVPWIVTMEEVSPSETDLSLSPGEALYSRRCATCHGPDLEGHPPQFPALTDLEDRLTRDSVRTLVREGRGLMPAFAQLEAEDVEALLGFLFEDGEASATGEDGTRAASGAPEPNESDGETGAGENVWYSRTGWHRFMDPDGYPAVEPPWGTLNAVDLVSGEIAWKVPLGAYPELAAEGREDTGTETFGGTIVTGGGLVFVGATKDRKFRAFDRETGELLWETTLPTGGNATPSTYLADGTQYVLIAAGGGAGSRNSSPHETKAGDAYVAFALP